MNEISTPMSKFVLCPFRASSLGVEASTVARRCPRLLPIAWEGFSTLSLVYRASLHKNSMPAMEQLLIQKILCTYLTLLLDSAHQILHRGEEPDPDNSADGSYRQSWRWSGVTSRCSQEGSSAIFASSGES